MSGLSRVDNSALARWWWSVDLASLTLILMIATVGFVLLMAAGPAAAARLGIADSFHFPMRQLAFLAPALALMLGVSMMSKLQARRTGAVVLILSVAALAAALAFSPEVNGAKRWINLGAIGFQPSEFVKPGFIVVAAWMLAEGARNPRFPGLAIAAGLYAALLVLLAMQPDYGQAALLTAVFFTMFFIVGWNWKWIAAIGAAGACAFLGGYIYSPHMAARIESFLNPDAAESYQVNKALEAIHHGGLIGRGAEGAIVKMQLPDSHTDFIFAVAGEEYGFFVCLAVLALFVLLVLRLLFNAARLKSVFGQCAVSGLAVVIGLQSFINMAVSLRTLPAKGMTLPFISYGGSSLIATGLTFGLLLALMRTEGPVRRRREIMP
jgi:cell division protein FtsW